jgi:hypothetical protein
MNEPALPEWGVSLINEADFLMLSNYQLPFQVA